MADSDLLMEKRQIRMETDFDSLDISIKNARVTEGLSQISEIMVEFLSKDKAIKLEEFLGSNVTIMIDDADENERYFNGKVVSAEFIGLYQGKGHYVIEVRPFLWFLNLTQENRIFQEKSTVEIIMEIMGDYGFSGDIEKKLSETYPPRTYCVQYRESDFDFICRLMEEEGIYYFFTNDGKIEKMVLADGISAHKPTPGGPEFEFKFREYSEGGQSEYRKRDDHVFDWNAVENTTTGKVMLNDYDFEKPKADQKKVTSMPKGKHSYKSYEHYDYPGHYRPENVPNEGSRLSKVKAESMAAEYQRWRGASNIRTMGVGQTFKLKDHPRVSDKKEFLILKAVHYFQIETDYEDTETKNKIIDDRRIDWDENNQDSYRCIFECMPKSDPYRAPKETPWPRIVGLHTAVVTGPSGEEIFTDKYGRIKVQFHWDRLGKKDDKTTCWVRTVMPWTGKDWGMIAIPRIGQEVVIQFEEGDPDRPICTGMLYNADTMPPYALDANKTQSGIKTRSSKQGSAENYHELVFEDKKGEEFIRFHSEKDYFQTVENDAVINIGLDKKDPGDLTQTIHRHKTETVKTGDKTITVETGNEFRDIATNQEETIGVDRKQEIGSNSDVKIGMDSKLDVGMNLTEKIGVTHKNEAGVSIEYKAGTKIELKCGGSTITMTPASIEIKSPMITVQGNATVDVKAPMTTVKGDAMLTLKGGLTMIN